MPEQRSGPNIITDKPLEFSFDPDTGIVLMTIVGGGEIYDPLAKQKRELQMIFRVALTQETSRSLLAALPNLQSILERAIEGPSKQGSVQ
jgi:hypothetical protein